MKKKIWYNDFTPSDTGIDGTKQVIKFLKAIKKTNFNNIIMPLISLCDTNKIKKIIKKENFQINSLIKQEWPMPKNLVSREREQLIKLKNEKKINFRVIYGLFVANTEILYLKKKIVIIQIGLNCFRKTILYIFTYYLETGLHISQELRNLMYGIWKIKNI